MKSYCEGCQLRDIKGPSMICIHQDAAEKGHIIYWDDHLEHFVSKDCPNSR